MKNCVGTIVILTLSLLLPLAGLAQERDSSSQADEEIYIIRLAMIDKSSIFDHLNRLPDEISHFRAEKDGRINLDGLVYYLRNWVEAWFEECLSISSEDGAPFEEFYYRDGNLKYKTPPSAYLGVYAITNDAILTYSVQTWSEENDAPGDTGEVNFKMTIEQENQAQ